MNQPVIDLNSRHPEAYQQLLREHGSPLLVLDCEALRQQYRSLCRALPGVIHHYAIKALPNPAVVATLNQEGASFDIATSGEIAMLQELHINPRATIHTHPIKTDREIREALRFGCTTFVVDNPVELEKLAPYRSRVGLLLRISFRSPTAQVDLSKKFGCAPDQALQMLMRARQLGLHIKGLSFHVGSQSGTPDMHVQAIEACNQLIRTAQENGFLLSILDIGGGFPVKYDDSTPDIETFCAPIREALTQLPENVHIFSEPGRYLAAPAVTSIATVIGKAKRDNYLWYYLDDGVYNSFSGQIYDHARYPLEALPLNQGSAPGAPACYPSVLAGPTCDSIDVIAENLPLPELQLGDLIIGRMMGAYTAASATNFNSLERARVLVINQDETPAEIAYIA